MPLYRSRWVPIPTTASVAPAAFVLIALIPVFETLSVQAPGHDTETVSTTRIGGTAGVTLRLQVKAIVPLVETQSKGAAAIASG